MTVQEATWVGEGRSKISVRSPLPAKTRATSSENASAPKRQSYPITASGSGALVFR